MRLINQNSFLDKLEHPETVTVKTTLYDLIQAVNEEIDPVEDWLVSEIVVDLLGADQIKLPGSKEFTSQKLQCIGWT